VSRLILSNEHIIINIIILERNKHTQQYTPTRRR